MSKVFSAHAVSVDGFISGRDLRPGRENGPGDDPYLDIARLTHDTGFTPTYDVATSVTDYVAWRADNHR